MVPSTAGLFAAGLVLAVSLTSVAAAEPPLALEATIPLANVSGRIDHMAVDLGRNRLLIAELGNNSVDVVDLAASKVAHRIGGLAEPQGVGYMPGPDIIAVANAGDGSVRLFHGGDFAPAGQIPLGSDADNIRLDPRSERLIVGYGEGALALIDGATLKMAGNITLAAHPESFQIDAKSNRAFVNVPDGHRIAIIDLAAGKQVAAWKLPGLSANFPMALDAPNGTVLVVTRAPPRLVAVDAATGKILAQTEACGDADDVFVDAKRGRIYVSCGVGVVDVFGREVARFRHLGRIATSSGARTSLWAPQRDRLYVAARAGLLGSEASLLVFRPAP